MAGSAAERMARRKFWRAWAGRAVVEVGALLAEQVDEGLPPDPDVDTARALLIQAEAYLSGSRTLAK